MPSEFKMFESGPGGEFETYIGSQTGTIYRLDLSQIHYHGASRPDLLAEAMKREGNLICVPEEITCKICGTVFSATTIPVDGEEFVEAYEI